MRLNTSLYRSSELFLGNIATNWSVEADQSDEGNFRLSDLQIPYSSAQSGTTQTFTMKHRMGVAEIELKTATYYAIAESNSGTSTITRTTDTNESVTASSSFDSSGSYHVPLRKGSTAFYYAVVPTGTSETQFNSTSGTDQWATAYTATGIASGNLDHYDAFSTRVGTSTYSGQFSYSGTYLTFTVPFTGTYTIECWGASSFVNNDNDYSEVKGAYAGGYVRGNIVLSTGDKLYVYVGEHGISSNEQRFNGGGASASKGGTYGPTGGGGTDVRLKKGATWAENESLCSRIIVAGGGGGISGSANCAGSSGGLEGYQGRDNPWDNNCGKGGTQTSGGAIGERYSTAPLGNAGQFGYGGAGTASINTGGGGGGGGGWYGGAGAGGASNGAFGGGGGSSYISGHPGCVARTGYVGSQSYITRYNSKDWEFSDRLMIDGGGYKWTTSKGAQEKMPKPSGGYYDLGYGHYGHGYCLITGTTATP